MNMPFLQLSKVEMLRIARNRYFMFYAILLPLVYYVILSYANKQVNHAYLLIAMLLFSLLSGAVTTFAIGLATDNNRNWRKIMKALPINEANIIGAKLFSQLMLNVISILVLILFVHAFHPLPGNVWQWGMIALWFICISAVFMTLGAAISSFGKQGTVSGLANFAWIFIVIASGTWFSLDEFPEWIQFLASGSPGTIAITGAFRLLEGNYNLTWQFIGLVCYALFFISIHFIILKIKRKEVSG